MWALGNKPGPSESPASAFSHQAVVSAPRHTFRYMISVRNETVFHPNTKLTRLHLAPKIREDQTHLLRYDHTGNNQLLGLSEVMDPRGEPKATPLLNHHSP